MCPRQKIRPVILTGIGMLAYAVADILDDPTEKVRLELSNSPERIEDSDSDLLEYKYKAAVYNDSSNPIRLVGLSAC